MNAPNNAASRMATVIDRARPLNRDGQVKAIDVWADAFEVEADAPPVRRQHDVAHGLTLLWHELDRIEMALPSRTTVPQSTYGPKLARLRQAVGLEHLFSTWHPHVTQFLTADDALNYLRDTVAYLLGAEETPAPATALDRLREILRELVTDPTTMADEAPPLRAFVLRLSESLLRALRDYAVVGEAALRDEVERLTWEWSRLEREHPKAKKSPAWKRIAKVLAAASACVIGGQKLLEAGAKLPGNIRQIQAAMPEMRALLGLPEPERTKRLARPKEVKLIPAVTGAEAPNGAGDAGTLGNGSEPRGTGADDPAPDG